MATKLIISIMAVIILLLGVGYAYKATQHPVVYLLKQSDIRITLEGEWQGNTIYTLEFPDGRAMESVTADEVVDGFISGKFEYKK